MYSALKEKMLGILKGAGMVAFPKKMVSNYQVQLDTATNDIRSMRYVFWVLYLVPFFWDTDISLDLKMEFYNRKVKPEKVAWVYRWELRDLDKNLIRQGGDTLSLKGDRSIQRKERAISLGNLSPNKQYLLYLSINHSDLIKVFSFTTKDRDEIYLQLFIGIILIFITIFLTQMSKGG